MFTRCPTCKTVHPLTAKTLSYRRGSVQCGQCSTKFSAVNCLFDQWPSGQAFSPATGKKAKAPIIGAVSKSAATGKKPEEKEVEEKEAEENETDAIEFDPQRQTWRMLTALLVVATIVNTGWTFREPMLQNPTVNNWFKHNGWLQDESEGLLKDPDQIQLISRDMHSHPTRSGILVLSLTFVNLAQRPQVFPTLEITLLDGSGQPIAQRHFQPTDYLRPGANTESGLATDVFLPVLLELGDPGQRAVGFEIQFL